VEARAPAAVNSNRRASAGFLDYRFDFSYFFVASPKVKMHCGQLSAYFFIVEFLVAQKNDKLPVVGSHCDLRGSSPPSRAEVVKPFLPPAKR
jgi:hypothetical protein